MIELFLYSVFGILIGLLAGIIPGLGPFAAVALSYPLLLIASPISIMAFYISILISSNYSNAVTAILYGIPGDASAIPTAKIGHRFFLKGYGSLAVGVTSFSSTFGVLFSFIAFLLFLPVISDVFIFYNSIIQVVLILASIILIIWFNNQNKIVSFALFLFGIFLARIGVDPVTFETFFTFGNPYLSLGIPFGAVMVGLYLVPEFFKIQDLTYYKQTKVNNVSIGKNITAPTLLGSFIGFWCGLIPGITNILGSYLSFRITKKFFKKPNLKSLAAAEAANNSGAMSSLLPLLLLSIPITGSEILIYYLMAQQGFRFTLDNTIAVLYNIIYVIPIVTAVSFLFNWYGFNLLARVALFYKDHKTKVNAAVLTTVMITNILIFPVKTWIITCLFVLMVLGYFLKSYDTSPIIYGYFLGELLYQSFIRSLVILS